MVLRTTMVHLGLVLSMFMIAYENLMHGCGVTLCCILN